MTVLQSCPIMTETTRRDNPNTLVVFWSRPSLLNLVRIKRSNTAASLIQDVAMWM